MSGALLVYDISDRSTYDSATRWLKDLRYHGDADTRIMLVGNKSDLQRRRQTTFNEAKAFAGPCGLVPCIYNCSYLSATAENNILFIETSARDSSKVEPAFQTLLNGASRASVYEEDFPNHFLQKYIKPFRGNL